MIRFFNVFALFVGLFVVVGSARSEDSELPAWLLHTKFSGDFRYLHEYIHQEEFTGDSLSDFDRNRHRIRLRVSLISNPSDRVTVGFRLASGTGDRRSTNQDMTGSFSEKGVWVDRAYLDVHPDESWSFSAGKLPPPFTTVSQLVWDGDINPEGIVAVHECKPLGISAKLWGGGFWLQEFKRDDDQGLLAAQLTLKQDRDDVSWQFAAGYYDYQNAQGGSLFIEAAGNTQQTRGDDGSVLPYYKNDYNLVNISGKAEVAVANKTKLALFFEAVENTAIEIDRDGITGGASLSVKGKLPYSMMYAYHDVDADATIAAFVGSDFADGWTDAAGHEIGLSCTPWKELQINGKLLLCTMQKTTRELDFKRLMVDATVKF